MVRGTAPVVGERVAKRDSCEFFYITRVEITYRIQASVMDKILTFIIFTDATFPSICGKA